VSDGIAPSIARQLVYNVSVTVLVYIIIVSGKIARPALPPFVHCTPRAVSAAPLSHLPNSHSSLSRMSQIEKKVQDLHAALEESPPDRFESVYLSAIPNSLLEIIAIGTLNGWRSRQTHFGQTGMCRISPAPLKR
jgi:hypothetical protein